MLNKICDNMRDSAISYLLSKYHANTGLMLYNIASNSPVDIAVALLAGKLGIPPLVLTLIIAFL